MTDNEIIKALECCVSEQYTCEQCPYQEVKHYDYDNGFEIMPNGKQYDDWSCDRWLNTDLLDLINRQKAEILELQKRIINWRADMDYRPDEIKSEAIKEFAEELEYFVLNEDIEVAEPKCKDYESYINGANQFRHQIKNGINNLVKK